jgi:hypothetical protein
MKIYDKDGFLYLSDEVFDFIEKGIACCMFCIFLPFILIGWIYKTIKKRLGKDE